jgi:hypothetical protein
MSLEELEARRAGLLAELAGVGDFRRGSVSQSYRRCGKPNCACARPGHPGHGPRTMWTRRGAGGKTVGRALLPAEVDKVQAEVAAYHRFRELADALAEVNEAICEARPAAGVAPPGTAGTIAEAAADGQKGGSRAGSGRRSRRRSPTSSTG